MFCHFQLLILRLNLPMANANSGFGGWGSFPESCTSRFPQASDHRIQMFQSVFYGRRDYRMSLCFLTHFASSSTCMQE